MVESKSQGKKRGILFIISAPSGAGKTTLLRKVMNQVPNLRFSVSFTTRKPRANEHEGEDYHFVSQSVFQKMAEKNDFLEWAEVLGNFYGTPRRYLKVIESEGSDLILDIDTQGARKVIEQVPHAVLIYILPPSLRTLQKRMEKRGLDPPEMIKFRLASARRDVQEAHWYHYVIVNDKIEEAIEQLKSVIIAERCRENKAAILEERKHSWEESDG